MDRNLWWGVRKAVGSLVALRKESVDRNCDSDPVTDKAWASLSARRAWIEIAQWIFSGIGGAVALRKESVDRNIKGSPYLQIGRQSLSARRAWIEIARVAGLALLPNSRSPQGERG